jgi:prolyl-tRNA synthetase
MLLSKLFLPVLKEDPKEAAIVSHRLMLRAGMIRQLASGIYNWLPLGLKVLNKVANIIRQEMDNIGSQEILMPCIQPVDLWIKSGRYGTKDDLGTEMLKITDRHDNKLTFSPTAEEVVAELVGQNLQSYKSLPLSVYQVAWKFRDEIRPRFGVMRGREFLMKDAYTFHMTKECALNSYRDMLNAYIKAYKRMGLTALPVKADTGAMGGDYSHEFHILADTGESEVFYEEDVLEYLSNTDEITLEEFAKFYANEKDKHDPQNCGVPEDKIRSKRGIEVGHIFYLGDKYSKAMGCEVQDKDGKKVNPLMGCYGIGVSRLIGAIIEANHDEKGIIWPQSVAPFEFAIINLKPSDDKCDEVAQELYDFARANNKDVLLDDVQNSVGAKFSTMELIGIPWVIVVGPKGLAAGVVEVRNRKSGEHHEMSLDAVKTIIAQL